MKLNFSIFEPICKPNLPRSKRCEVDGGDGLGDVEAAVGREAVEDDVVEARAGGAAPGAYVPHTLLAVRGGDTDTDGGDGPS